MIKRLTEESCFEWRYADDLPEQAFIIIMTTLLFPIFLIIDLILSPFYLIAIVIESVNK